MWSRIAAALGFVGVALGAFGAHGLKTRVSPEMLEIWKTGVLYQLVHAVAMLAVARAAVAETSSGGGRPRIASRARRPAIVCGLWTAGVVVFSGSLYLLAVTGIRELGAVTPVGGLCFLAGWFLLAVFPAASYTKNSVTDVKDETKQGDPTT